MVIAGLNDLFILNFLNQLELVLILVFYVCPINGPGIMVFLRKEYSIINA